MLLPVALVQNAAQRTSSSAATLNRHAAVVYPLTVPVAGAVAFYEALQHAPLVQHLASLSQSVQAGPSP